MTVRGCLSALAAPFKNDNPKQKRNIIVALLALAIIGGVAASAALFHSQIGHGLKGFGHTVSAKWHASSAFRTGVYATAGTIGGLLVLGGGLYACASYAGTSFAKSMTDFK